MASLVEREGSLDAALITFVLLYAAFVALWQTLSPREAITPYVTIPVLSLALAAVALKVSCLLARHRQVRFGVTEILALLAIYLIPVLAFASLYHSLYQNGPTDAFHLLKGADESRIDANIKKLLAASSEDSMRLAYQSYQAAAAKSASEATKCYEAPDTGQPPSASNASQKVPRFTCLTDKGMEEQLLKQYAAGIDPTLVRAFREYQTELAEQGRLTYIDFLYFSAVTSATVGYGDITPGTAVTKLVVVFQIGINLFLTLVLVNLLIGSRKS